MKKRSSKIKSLIRNLIYEALANKFGQGGDIEGAEAVANAHWGNVYLVMPKGEADHNVFYRVTLHNSSGPVKYLKQDQQGRWFFMDPPNKIWRPVNPAKVAVAECATCGCGDPTDDHSDDMQGDTTDVHTMDAVNVAEAINYRQSSDELIKAYTQWKNTTPADTKSHNAVAFTAGWNAAMAIANKPGLNEDTKNSVVGKKIEYLSNPKSDDDVGTDPDSIWKPGIIKKDFTLHINEYEIRDLRTREIHYVPPHQVRDFNNENIHEQSSVASATPGGQEGGTIRTPYAFSARGDGSKKATAASERTGYKRVKKAY